jgi:(+)-neomenthol dehydrogenase
MDVVKRFEWMCQNSRETLDTAKHGLQTNYYGSKHVTEGLLPLLQASSDGRIVNVSSEWGRLKVSSIIQITIFQQTTPVFEIVLLKLAGDNILEMERVAPFGLHMLNLKVLLSIPLQLFNNEKLKQELNDVDNLTEERLDELLAKFLKDYEAGAVESQGWPIAFSAYKVAKAAMNAYSRILARRYPELRVNCVHPGYVKTDITMNSGLLSPEEGAANVTKVALLPAGGPTGLYFAGGEEAPFL